MNVNIKKKIKPITLFLLALIFNNYLSHSSYAAEITEDVSNIQYNIDPIIRDLLRVRSVGYRLAKANSGRCAIPTMQTGLIVHDIGGFSEFDRAAAMRDYGLTYGFGIIAVVEGSPAMRAGARVGDEIVGINGQDLSRFAKEAVKRKASYDRVEAFEDFLQIALLERDIILPLFRLIGFISDR